MRLQSASCKRWYTMLAGNQRFDITCDHSRTKTKAHRGFHGLRGFLKSNAIVFCLRKPAEDSFRECLAAAWATETPSGCSALSMTILRRIRVNLRPSAAKAFAFRRVSAVKNPTNPP